MKTSKKNVLLLLQWLEESLRQNIFPLDFMTTPNKLNVKGNGEDFSNYDRSFRKIEILPPLGI